MSEHKFEIEWTQQARLWSVTAETQEIALLVGESLSLNPSVGSVRVTGIVKQWSRVEESTAAPCSVRQVTPIEAANHD